MSFYDAATLPFYEPDDGFAVRLTFAINEHVSDAGLNELLVSLGLRPAGTSYRIRIIRERMRELTLIGDVESDLQTYARRVLEKILEIGDMVEDDLPATKEPVSFESEPSAWVFEPPTEE